MENVSAVTSFILTAYTELEDHRYLYFIGFLLLYILTLSANSVLLLVIYIEKSLHEPMYFFICNLAASQIYGSTSILPSILCHLLSHNHEISLVFCLLQIFCIHLYSSTEFATLGVMGYDRYVAICCPLHYHLIMSHRKVCILLSMCWIYPCIILGLYFMLTVQRKFCDRFMDKMFCMNFALVRLSCFEIYFQSIVGLFVTVCMVVPVLLMILYSYAQILRICLFASKESQAKAIKTCTPHILTVISYAMAGFYEVVQSRLNMSHLSGKVLVFLSLFSVIFILIINPVIYGICVQTIRVQIHKLFSGKIIS